MGHHETRFLHKAGIVHGAVKHLTGANKARLMSNLIRTEAVAIPGIEGAMLKYRTAWWQMKAPQAEIS